MKAIVLYDKGGKFGFEPDWTKPTPKDGEALVKVAYTGICGSDLPRLGSLGSYHHPMILGHEFSGVIEIPPTKSDKFMEGDPVAVLPIIPCGECESCKAGMSPFHCKQYQFIGSRNDGGFAEYCVVPEANLFKLESSEELMAGIFVEPLCVALHVVRRSGFIPGTNAIVFGAGPIGLGIALILRAFGALRVVVADLRSYSLEIAGQCGFETVNPMIMPEWGNTFEFAYEAAGSAKAISSAVMWLKNAGTLTVVGRDVSDTIIPNTIFEKLMRKELTVLGSWGYNLGDDDDLLRKIIKDSHTFLEKLVSHKITFEEAPKVINGMLEKSFDYCKVLIDPTK